MAMICFFGSFFRICSCARAGSGRLPGRQTHVPCMFISELEASGTRKEDLGDEGGVDDDLRREVILELPASSGWRGNISKGMEPVKEEVQLTTIYWTELDLCFALAETTPFSGRPHLCWCRRSRST